MTAAVLDIAAGPFGADPRAAQLAPPDKIDRRKLAVFGVMTFGMFMAILDIQIVAASLPQIQAGLAASAEQISWVQTAYLIAEVMVIPASGYLSRALSTRVIFALSAGGFTVASLGCAFAWNIESLIVLRAIQGFVGGAMIPVVFATAFSSFPRNRQAPISAAIGLIVTLAPTIGPTVGGAISEYLSWHWLFLVNIIPGALIAITVWLYGDFDKPEPALIRRLDVRGFVFMAAAVGLAQYVLEEGPDEDWFDNPAITVFTIVAVVSLALFIRRTLTVANPIVDLNAYRNRNFLFGNLASLAMGAMLYGLVYILPLFLARVRGFNSLQIGEALFITGAAMFLSAPAAAMASRVIEPRIVAIFGVSLAAGSTYAMSFLTSEWGYWELFWPQVARGAGLMLAMAPLNVISLGTLSPLQVRSASGLYNVMRNLGGAFGLAVINTALTDRAAYHARVLTDHLDPGRAIVAERIETLRTLFEARGAADPAGAAMKTLSLIVEREATALAFADTMRLIVVISVAAALFIALAAPPKAVAEGGH